MKNLLWILVVWGSAMLPYTTQAQDPPPVQWVSENAPSISTRYHDVLARTQTPNQPDTLYTAGDNLYRRDPDGTWTDNLRTNGIDILVTRRGTLILPWGSRIERSTDAGRTWNRTIDDFVVNGLLQLSLPAWPDMLLAFDPERGHFRSTDDGATWQVHSTQLRLSGTLSCRLTEVVPSASLPQGRILMGCAGGLLRRSEDGGVTWQRTAPFGLPIDLSEQPIEQAVDAAHPYGGTLFGAFRDVPDGMNLQASLWSSEDGGETWTRRSGFPPGSFGYSSLDEDPSLALDGRGTIWMGIGKVKGGPRPYNGLVVRSVDGGYTWTAETAGWGGWMPRDLLFDRSGVLWAATDRGVYRTTTPVVSTEEVGAVPSGLSVAVHPNPSSGVVSVELGVQTPGWVRVSVVDVLGREVSVLSEGDRTAGTHRLSFGTAGLPSGVYVVRVATAGGVATRAVTVVR